MVDKTIPELYVNKIHNKDAHILGEMTSPKNWDYARFKKVLISLAMVGNGQSIPARNRPETIHIQRWRPFIDDLNEKSKANGREHARAILADKDKKALIMSGKISVGTATHARLDLSLQPGREEYQSPVATMHVHPMEGLVPQMEHGLSGQDYRTFLNDSRQQAMLITYGDNLIMSLKTSVTPNNLSKGIVDRRIKECEEDYLRKPGEHYWKRVVDFNKAVCSENGLTMYIATKEDRDLMNRVEVTK